MSLATFAPPVSPALADVIDVTAAASGTWVLAERCGTLIHHGVGGGPCPPLVVEVLLTKRLAGLRHGVCWTAGRDDLRGRAEGVDVAALDLGEGWSIWLVGGDVEASLHAATALRDASRSDDVVHDAFIHDQLQPRLLRPRSSPAPATLLVLTGHQHTQQLARVALAAARGTTRVHSAASVIVSAGCGSDLSRLVADVRRQIPDACGGIAEVPEGAADWLTTVELAGRLAECAQELELPYCDGSMPEAVARLAARAARQAATSWAQQLSGSPLSRLQSCDTDGGPDLLETVRAWCRHGFSIPETAAALRLHRNTARYRLRRASEVSGLDLTRTDHQIAMWLLVEQDRSW